MPTTSIEWKRHYHMLSESESDEVVELVADLIVNFLKGKRVQEHSAIRKQSRDHERNAVQHEAC